MKNTGILILAQADHLTGEEIGFAVDQIVSWGAHNVYVFPGITKKNRSGCVLLIDISPGEEAEWGKLLSEELSIYGYHLILTSHFCSRCRLQSYTTIVRKGRSRLETEVRFKISRDKKAHSRVEHSDLVRLREQVRQKLKTTISLSTLRAYLESSAAANKRGAIEIAL